MELIYICLVCVKRAKIRVNRSMNCSPTKVIKSVNVSYCRPVRLVFASDSFNCLFHLTSTKHTNLISYRYKTHILCNQPKKHKTFDSPHFLIWISIFIQSNFTKTNRNTNIGRLFNGQFYGLWPGNTKRLRMFIQSESEWNYFLRFCILFGTSYQCIEICEIIARFIGCNEKFIVWRHVSE